MEIESRELLSFNYYTYGEPFTGSCKGMRYRLKKASGDDGDYFDACVWPEPYAEAFTKEQDKKYRTFPFTPEGKEEAVAWLNECYEKDYAK